MSRCEEAPLLIDFYSSGELDAVMTTLQIVQEYGTAVIGDMDEAMMWANASLARGAETS